MTAVRLAFGRWNGAKALAWTASPGRVLPLLLLIVMIGGVLVLGIRTTHDLTCPPGADYFRDLGIAHTILDGRFGSDPAYPNQTLWYNPLFPAIIAGGSWITGLPLPVVSVRIGAYLNLLAPITFAILLFFLFDAWVALAGTAAFLFIVAADNPLMSWAPYTPWPVPSHFAQSLFYLTLILILLGLRSGRYRFFVAAGAMTGLTFLAHTAPAMVIGAVFTVLMLRAVLREWDADLTNPRLYRSVLQSVVFVIPAFVLALPFLWPIWTHYRFKILDPTPLTYLEDSITLENLGGVLRRDLASTSTFVALIGLFRLLVGKGLKPGTRSVTLLWLVVSLFLLGYGYGYQALVKLGLSPPTIVPPHHFLFYCTIAKAVLIGLGSIQVARLLFGMLGYLLPGLGRWLGPPGESRRQLAERTVIVLGLGCWLLAAMPRFVERGDFVAERAHSQEFASRADMLGACDWIRSQTDRDAVVLSTANVGLTVVALADRKVVAVDRWWSNPYMNGEERERTCASMFQALRSGDEEQFRYWAQKNNVRVFLSDEKTTRQLSSMPLPFLKEAFRSGAVRVMTLLPKG